MTQPKMLLRFKFIGICNFSDVVCPLTGHRDRDGEHRRQLSLGDAELVMAAQRRDLGAHTRTCKDTESLRRTKSPYGEAEHPGKMQQALVGSRS